LADAVATLPEAPAVISREGRRTFAELGARSERVARALMASGVTAGDRVALWAENRLEWPAICLGIWRSGAIIVPINTRLKGLEAADMLRRTRARLLFVLPSLLGNDYLTLLHEAAGPAVAERPFRDLPHLQAAVAIEPGPGTEGCLSYDEFLAGADQVSTEDLAAREGAIGADDPAEILFTSGTTGAPKGVLLGHQQLLRNYWDWSGINGLNHHDRSLLTSPYSHGPGINGNLVTSLMRRFASVLVDVFDPESTLELVRQEKVTVMLGPANLYARLMAAAEGGPAPELRLALVGMASIPPDLTARLRSEWSVQTLCNSYGAIESSVVTMTRPSDSDSVVETSSGRPLPGVEVRVVDGDGADQPPNTPGELLIRSQGVMLGYWEAPEQTAAAVDDDGWFASGDIATLDDDGNVAIVDRKKEVFMVGGFNVYPAEVESLLLHHPDLAHAAVVPVADERSGEVGVAFVVPLTDHAVDPDEVVTWARRSMANYKAPRRVVVLDELPLAPTGKTDRTLLKQQAAELVASHA